MRELNRTGWMHNRVRMVVASFLTKDLLQHWHEGARYFEEKLLDIETASNAGGWQWAAGAGVDPKPLRIFNPTLQARRFDPEGDYIRRHVPELASVPTKYIHEPSLMSPALQKEVGCVIGKDYPSPLVDHAEAARSFRLLSLERGRLTS
jgi:deoxyribodipyrimidine photo-lyase